MCKQQSLSFLALLVLSVLASPMLSSARKVVARPTQTLGCATVLCIEGTTCYEDGPTYQPRCCPPICQTFVAEKPICGSDGVTYYGVCALEHFSCRAGRQGVTKVRDGACEKDCKQQSQ